ncbi:MAG: SUMF1/EgtB/PvdO family nonheme iron enzyme [Bacteroidota bacterium]
MRKSAFSTVKKNINRIYRLVESGQFRKALDEFQETPFEFESIGVIRELNQLEQEHQHSDLDTNFYLIQRDRLRLLILELADKLERQYRETFLWERARLRRKDKHFQTYLKEFPKGKYAEDAAWQVAQLENSRASYESYMHQYPGGIFWDEAQKILEDGDYTFAFPPGSKRQKVWKRLFSFDMILIGGILLGGLLLMLLFRSFVFNFLKATPKRYEQVVSLEMGQLMVKVGADPILSAFHTEEDSLHLLAPFEFGKYEITQAQWEKVMGYNPSSSEACADCPVVQISWYEAILFCNRLSEIQGLDPYYLLDTTLQYVNNENIHSNREWVVERNPTASGFRLPGESEWDYVYKLGQVASFHINENREKSLGNFDYLLPTIHPVGTQVPNLLGIYDMESNVSEWCWDSYTQVLPLESAETSSLIPKVVKGPNYLELSAKKTPVNRKAVSPFTRVANLGLRLARTLPPFMDMVPIQGATFEVGSESMGSRPNERPIREVEVEAYSIGRYEITQAQWASVMEIDTFTTCPECPAFKVSWYDAVSFCNKLSQLHGYKPYYKVVSQPLFTRFLNPEERGIWKISYDTTANGYRLPTEVEWEFAAKGGRDEAEFSKYPGSHTLKEVAWYVENTLFERYENDTTAFLRLADISPQPVGEKESNSLGIYDMAGNIWEWCEDTYHMYPSGVSPWPSENFPYTDKKMRKVLRGGGYLSSAYYCRIPVRMGRYPTLQSKSWGFRVVRSLEN